MTIILQTSYYLFFLLKYLKRRYLALKLLNLITKGDSFFFSDKIYNFPAQKLVPRLLLLLPGKGCEWFRKSGGCTMCGFPPRTRGIGRFLSGKDLVSLTKVALLMHENQAPYIVMIYNGGSFLNPNEITTGAQLQIIKLLAKHPTIQEIFIESRAEFVTKENVEVIKRELNGEKLIIGIGLEAQDDKIRNVYIRKGLEKKDYEKAIRILKENGIKSLTYVFLKPIHVKEREAIEEAVKTIKYAFNVGTDEVALESAFIQKGTIMEKLYNEKQFRPPWLWSIIEVVNRTKKLGPIYVGGFEDEPPPIAVPFNCSRCSDDIKKAIDRYRQTYNLKYLENLYCKCKQEWQKQIK